MTIDGMIEITGCDIRDFMRDVYAMSKPQGMGFMQYREGGLDDETIDEILAYYKTHPRIALHMDYVHGRACKMCVWKTDADIDKAQIYMPDSWYDHNEIQHEKLVQKHGKKQ